MNTAAWLTPLGPSYCRIGISRGVPRQQPVGSKKYRKLALEYWHLTGKHCLPVYGDM